MTGPGKLEAFSAQIRPREKRGEQKMNFYTNPGQKGTGYGSGSSIFSFLKIRFLSEFFKNYHPTVKSYLNVTIGAYVENGVDPYNRASQIRAKQAKDSKDKIRGSSFKTISAPQPTFDVNPYKTDKVFPTKANWLISLFLRNLNNKFIMKKPSLKGKGKNAAPSKTLQIPDTGPCTGRQ